jgi:hypothetical protein
VVVLILPGTRESNDATVIVQLRIVKHPLPTSRLWADKKVKVSTTPYIIVSYVRDKWIFAGFKTFRLELGYDEPFPTSNLFSSSPIVTMALTSYNRPGKQKRDTLSTGRETTVS